MTCRFGVAEDKFGATGVLYALTESAQSPGAWITVGTPGDVLGFLAFSLVGALISSRRPQNPIGWICLAACFLWKVLMITDQYSLYGAASAGSVPFPVAAGTLGNQWLWVPTVGLFGIYMLLLFPDGRFQSRRWRPLAWISGPLEIQGGVRNPGTFRS